MLGLQSVIVVWFILYHVGFIPALKRETFALIFRKPGAGFEPAMIRSAGGRVRPDSATLARLTLPRWSA